MSSIFTITKKNWRVMEFNQHPIRIQRVSKTSVYMSLIFETDHFFVCLCFRNNLVYLLNVWHVINELARLVIFWNDNLKNDLAYLQNHDKVAEDGPYPADRDIVITWKLVGIQNSTGMVFNPFLINVTGPINFRIL